MTTNHEAMAAALEAQGRRSNWLAEKLGISRQQMTHVLKGRRDMAPDKWALAADLLGLPRRDIAAKHHDQPAQ